MSFPLVVELGGRTCLVVGHSAEALFRVQRFVRAGARVRWITGAGVLEATAEVSLDSELLATRTVVVEQREWLPSDLDDCWLVILADRDEACGARLRAACDERRLFFCAIDQPRVNSFSHVAVVEQGAVQIAIATGGKVPALARRLRVLMGELLGDGRLAAFAEHLAQLRASLPAAERKQALEQALSGLRLEGRLVVPPHSNSGNDEGSGAG